MTDEQKKSVRKLRAENQSYVTIARELGVSVSAVKSFCQRNGLTGFRAVTIKEPEPEITTCKCCGKPITQKAGIKEIKFCSGTCRQSWWNSHPEKVNRKAVYSFTCACCGTPFTAYGNANRKYCCHACYIEGRYGRRAAQ